MQAALKEAESILKGSPCRFKGYPSPFVVDYVKEAVSRLQGEIQQLQRVGNPRLSLYIIPYVGLRLRHTCMQNRPMIKARHCARRSDNLSELMPQPLADQGHIIRLATARWVLPLPEID